MGERHAVICLEGLESGAGNGDPVQREFAYIAGLGDYIGVEMLRRLMTVCLLGIQLLREKIHGSGLQIPRRHKGVCRIAVDIAFGRQTGVLAYLVLCRSGCINEAGDRMAGFNHHFLTRVAVQTDRVQRLAAVKGVIQRGGITGLGVIEGNRDFRSVFQSGDISDI